MYIVYDSFSKDKEVKRFRREKKAIKYKDKLNKEVNMLTYYILPYEERYKVLYPK